MCAITLTVLQTCKHELPTIEYCPDAATRVRKYNRKRELGVDAPPPEACTDSLGWTIFKRIEAPVLCEGCKMWLFLNGKTTYASMIGPGQPEAKPAADGSHDIAEKHLKIEEGTDGGGEDIATKQNKAMEMEKLRSNLSRQFGITGQRRKTPF